MADDNNNNEPNKSNKPINSGNHSASSDADNLLKQVQTLRDKETKESLEKRQQGRHWREAQRTENKVYQSLRENYKDGEPIDDIIDQAQKLGNATGRRKEVQAQFLSSKEQSELVANNSLVNKTASFTSDKSSRSRIAGISSQTSTLGQAVNSAGQGSYFDMEESRASSQNKLGSLNNQLQSIAQASKFDEKAYRKVSGLIGEEEQNVAISEKAMGLQKSAGKDPKSILLQAEKNLEKARKEGIVEDAAQNAGKKGYTLKDARQEKTGLNKELKDFKDQLNASTISLKEYAEGTDKINDSISDLDDKIAGIKGGGGRGFVDKLNMGRQAVGAASIAIGAASQVGLENELEETGQRAVFANMANTQYQNVDKLVGGDMGALLQLTQGDEFQKQYSDNMGSRAGWLKGGEVATNVLDAGLATTAAGIEVAGALVGDVDAVKALEGVNMAASSTANAVTGADRAIRGTMTGQYKAQGQQQAKGLVQAINAIPTDTLQEYFNTNKAAFDSGIGMGGAARNKFMGDFTNSDNMKKFADVGMTPREAIRTAQMGAQALGTSEDFSELALKAGKAELSGTLSKEQYMGAAGALSASGGGSAELESIMSKAVTVGMDNSKNIMQMANATASLAQGSAAGGFGTTGAASEMIMSSVQSMRSVGVDKNIATTAAANINAQFGQAVNKKGSYADLKQRSQFEKLYGETDYAESIALAGLTEDQMNSIANGGEEGYNVAKGKGLEKFFGMNEKGEFAPGFKAKALEGQRIKAEKGVVDTIGIAALSDPQIKEELVSLRTGKLKIEDASDRTKQIWGGMTNTRASGLVSQGASGVDPESIADNANTTAMKKMKKAEADRVRGKVDSGGAELEKFGGLAGLADVMTKAIEAGSPEKMAKAVSDAAEKLETPGQIFNEGANKFDSAVNSFIKHLGSLGVNVETPKKKDVMKNVPTAKGGGSQKSGVLKTSQAAEAVPIFDSNPWD